MLHQLDEVERMPAVGQRIVEVKRQDSEQHQDGAGQRIEKELDGGIKLARPTPHANDEVHRNQHDFPEHVEEEEIERHENAEHPRLEQKEHGVVFLHALLDGCPRREDGEKTQHRGQHDQQKADAINAQVVLRADGRNPIVLLNEFELLRRGLTREPEDEGQGSEEVHEQYDVPPPPNRLLVLPGDEEERNHPRHRDKQNDAQNMVMKERHR